MESVGEMGAPNRTSSTDPGTDVTSSQTPDHSSLSFPLRRHPISESPLSTLNLGSRQDTQKEHDAELIKRGRGYVGKIIGEVGRKDSGSMRRYKD